MPRLLALFGPRRGVLLELATRLVVGRSGEADLQLLDEKVSREHCALEGSGEGWTVRDLGSRNGTWVNGERLASPARLRPGDQLGVGDSVLVFEPPYEPVPARDGSATLVVTETSAATARVGNASPRTLERAGELALKAALATSVEGASELLLDAVKEALQPDACAVLQRAGSGLRPSCARPAGTVLPVGRALLDLVASERRAFAMPERQARAESDAHTTRIRPKDGEVLCAPMFAGGEFAGALCLFRERAFAADEIALAGALVAAASSALVRAPAKPGEAAEFDAPVAESRAMREAMRLAAAAARVSSTVLLTGESGTGKEELAKAIHALGSRARGPFVAVNCGAIPAELAESELFGHEKGSFTGAVQARAGVFEQADGGTLFLDEVGDLPPNLQVKLLRALQERVVQRVGGRQPIPVDVRVVAATHRDLPALVKSGTFRDDLFWRLNVVAIPLAPLRERREDVLPLAERFLSRLSRRLGVRADGFTGEAREALLRCPWPGNARQLSNAIERALVLREATGPIGLSDLPAEVLASPRGSELPKSGASLGELVKALEKEQITLALKRAKGVKVAAAEALGISRPTLDRKIEEYAIDLFE